MLMKRGLIGGLLAVTAFALCTQSVLQAKDITVYDEYLGTNGYDDMTQKANTREMSPNHKRNGQFILADNGGSHTIYHATSFYTTWENGGVATYYCTSSGDIKKGNHTVVEVVENPVQEFELKGDFILFSQPFSFDSFNTGKVAKKGVYYTKRRTIDHIELLDANYQSIGWVTPQYDSDDKFLKTNMGSYPNSIATLSVNQVNNVPIHQMMMPIREDKRTGYAMLPQYVTIHNTANEGKGAGAENHAKAQINDSRSFVSWHYTVDDHEIYQSMPMNEVGYHAGDGLMMGNAGTIGIEICENADGNYAQAEKNAAYLAARILYENNLPSDRLRLHYDWSGKNCAHNIINNTKGSMGWDAFQALVKQEYDRIKASESENALAKAVPDEFHEVFQAIGLRFDQGYLRGMNVGMTLQELKDRLASPQTSSLKGIQTSITEAEGKTVVSTGKQITLFDQNNQPYRVALILKGDVSTDGQILANDYFMIKSYIEGKIELTQSQKKAADVSGDLKLLANDYFMIKKYKEGEYTIIQ